MSLLILGLTLPALPAYGNNDPQFEANVLQVIRDHPEAIIESLQVYQRQQRAQQEQRRQVFLQQMRTDPKSVIGQSPTKGASAQTIVLLVFSDFQCPYCATVHQTLQQFIDKHGDRVTLVYKHLPLAEIHPQALPAAFSAWAAGQQGKFWEFHDALFAHQPELGEPLYQATAKALNLNLDQFERDRHSEAAAIAIRHDLEMAQVLAIEGTPFLVMNGEVIPGAVELAELEAVFTHITQR